MLEAYNYKLHSVAERIMIEEGLHRLLKVYRYELDTSNQILLAKSNKSKLIKAYRFKLCPMAKNFIPKNAPSQQSTLLLLLRQKINFINFAKKKGTSKRFLFFTFITSICFIALRHSLPLSSKSLHTAF